MTPYQAAIAAKKAKKAAKKAAKVHATSVPPLATLPKESVFIPERPKCLLLQKMRFWYNTSWDITTGGVYPRMVFITGPIEDILEESIRLQDNVLFYGPEPHFSWGPGYKEITYAEACQRTQLTKLFERKL